MPTYTWRLAYAWFCDEGRPRHWTDGHRWVRDSFLSDGFGPRICGNDEGVLSCDFKVTSRVNVWRIEVKRGDILFWEIDEVLLSFSLFCFMGLTVCLKPKWSPTYQGNLVYNHIVWLSYPWELNLDNWSIYELIVN